MRMRLRFVAAGSILAWSLFGLGASASAATTIGQAPPTLGTAEQCNGSPLVQVSVSSGPDYAVPADGILTSWRSSVNGTVGFSVFREAGGAGEYTRIAANAETGDGTVQSFDARIPVLAGDRIGLEPASVAQNCVFLTGDNADVVAAPPSDAPIGGPPETYTPIPSYRLNVAAVVEADADGDGFGDDSQDLCPTDASTQGTCPDTVAPETTITKQPKDKTGKPKAKYRFVSDEAGATFECKLKGKGLNPAVKQFGSCTSPKRYKKLDPGKYRFAVRATDGAGNTDATAAKDKFKVVD
jgi:hypothetical protein